MNFHRNREFPQYPKVSFVSKILARKSIWLFLGGILVLVNLIAHYWLPSPVSRPKNDLVEKPIDVQKVEGAVNEGIPVINLQLNHGSAGHHNRARNPRIVEEVFRASHKTHFFLVTNHGIPEDVIDSLWKVQEQFFTRPKEIKSRVAFDAGRWMGWRTGYGGPGSKQEQYLIWNKELMDQANMWPSEADSAGFRDTLSAVSTAFEQLALHILHIVALGLELPEDFYDKNITGPPLESTTRMAIQYDPAPPKGKTRVAGSFKPHADAGLLTLLVQSSEGLEVSTHQGLDCHHAVVISNATFTRVPARKGEVGVFFGSMIDSATDGRLIAACHRARFTPDQLQSPIPRMSLAFFLNPNKNAYLQGPLGTYPRNPTTGGERVRQLAEWWQADSKLYRHYDAEHGSDWQNA